MKIILQVAFLFLVISCSPKVPDAILKSSKKDIISFSFDNLNPKIVAKIDSVNNKITATLPVGTDLVKQTPVIIVSEKATVSPTSGIIQDFTQPVRYTVTAEDGSTKFYEVKVVAIPKSSKKDIISFSFEINSVKIAAIIDSVKSTITAIVPIGTDIAKLTPIITISEKAGVNPASGVIQDFAQPVKYTVKAEDGSTKVYDVKVETEKPTSTVFISGGDGLCLALDAKTGKKKWEYNVGQTYIVSSPTYQDGNVYIGTLSESSNSKFIALDLITGRQKWVLTIPDSEDIISTPISTKGKIYLCTRNGKIYCLNIIDGKIIWQVFTNKSITSSPLIDNNFLYFVNEDGLQIYDTNNGQKKSRITALQSVLGVKGIDHPISSPVIANGVVYYINDGILNSYMINTKKNDLSLTVSKNTYIRLSSPTISKGFAFVTDEKTIYSIDLLNRKLGWEATWTPKNGRISSPLAIDDIVYATGGESIFAFNVLNGTKKWEYKSTESHFSSPTYFDKMLFIVNTEEILAIDATNGILKWKIPYKSGGLGLTPSPIVINELGEVFHSAISGAQQ